MFLYLRYDNINITTICRKYNERMKHKRFENDKRAKHVGILDEVVEKALIKLSKNGELQILKEQHENRRVRMTRQLMKDALLELMEQQELISISVTAICEKADVHRSTFYKYYTDPADLLRDIEHDILKMIPQPPKNLDQRNQEQLLTEITDFFDKVKRNKKAFQILLSESAGTSFATKLVEHLCDGYIPVNVTDNKDIDELSERFMRLYIANGTVGMLREWISSDFPVSSQKIAEMMFYYSRRVTS